MIRLSICLVREKKMNMATEWTVETLKAYLERRLDEIEKRVAERLDAMDRAVSKAEVAVEKRFESVNEFRSTLADQQRTFVPRPEFEGLHKSLLQKVETIESIFMEKTATLEKTFSTSLEIISKQVMERVAGAKGVSQGWAYAIGIIGVIVGIFGVIAAFTAKVH